MKNRRVPTIIGLGLVLVLVVAVAATTSVMQKVTNLFSQASLSVVPSSVGTANLTDKGFTVYWTTQAPTLGSVSYGKTTSMADGVAVDDRNLTAPNEKYLSHFVRIAGLTPNTKYYFNISGREGGPMTVTTLNGVPGNATVDPAFGKVSDASGTALPGVVAVLQVSGASSSATISKDDGSYVFPAIPQTTSGQSETVSFFYGADTATIVCKVSQDRPLPNVKMGDNLDCTKTTTGGTTTSATGSGGFNATTGTQNPVSGTLTINIVDKEVETTPLPTISGKSGPNQMVTIVVNSSAPITATVQADSVGNWTWTPPSNLSPGDHTVTVTVTNNDGTKQTITRTFTIPAGQTILPITSGTPSAQIFHNVCVNQACTQVSGAGTDSCTTSQDCAPAPIVAVTPPPPPPVATPPATVTTTTPPTTGALEDTFMFLFVGLFLIGLGFVPEVLQKLSD